MSIYEYRHYFLKKFSFDGKYAGKNGLLLSKRNGEKRINLSSIIKILNENKEDFSNLGNKDIEKFFQMDNLNQILRDVPRM